jgi:antitoxin (DNA-binding transcriptional repressor) of toxin-antitoxin stability system
MKTLNIREARRSMTNIDKLLDMEGEITITRRGEPIARMSPVGPRKSVPSHRALRESISRQKVQSETLVREDRDGRG